MKIVNLFKNNGQNSSNTSQAIWLGLGSLSSFGLGFASAVILSRYLNKSDYGTYRQILYVYNTLLVIFSAGLPKVYSYYLPRYSLENGKDIVWKVSKLLFICGLIFSILLFILSSPIAAALNNSELELGLKYFSPVPLLLLPTLGIEGILSSYKKTFYVFIYNTISRIVMLLLITMPIIIIKADYIYALYGWILSSIFSLIFAIYIKKLPFKKLQNSASSLSFKEILRYSFPVMTGSVAGIIVASSDQFFISRYFGPKIFAEFANGFMQLPIVGIVTGAVSAVLMPVFSKIAHKNYDLDKIFELWQSVLKKTAMIIYPLVIFFIFFASEIITIIFSSNYSNSIIYFRIALVINFFNIIMFTPLLLSLGKTKFYSNIHIVFAIIAWLGGYAIVLMVKTPIAIAVFSSIRTICLVLTSLIYVSLILKVPFAKLFPVKSLLLMIAHAFLILWLSNLFTLLLPDLHDIVKLLIVFSIYSFIYVFTARWIKLDYFGLFKSFINRS